VTVNIQYIDDDWFYIRNEKNEYRTAHDNYQHVYWTNEHAPVGEWEVFTYKSDKQDKKQLLFGIEYLVLL
jgi:hypothetical protein